MIRVIKEKQLDEMLFMGEQLYARRLVKRYRWWDIFKRRPVLDFEYSRAMMVPTARGSEVCIMPGVPDNATATVIELYRWMARRIEQELPVDREILPVPADKPFQTIEKLISVLRPMTFPGYNLPNYGDDQSFMALSSTGNGAAITFGNIRRARKVLKEIEDGES